jgi:rubrerythrin
MTMNEEMSSDQLRREMRTIEEMNHGVMPKWRELLERMMSGEEQLSTDQKASVFGVPSPTRRGLFKLGGASILGAAVLAACGSDSDTKSTSAPTTAASATTGAAATTGAPTTTATASTMAPATTGAAATTAATPTTAAGGPAMDLVLARTAASLEKLAVDVYGTAAGLLTTPAVKDAATLFAGHHQQHMDALNGVIKGAGATPVTEMNKAVYDALVAPALAKAKTEADAVMLAVMLEEAAAQTYVFAGGALSTPGLRSTIMTIGGVEARHAAVLRMAALAQTTDDIFPSKRAFFPGDNPLAGINGALITA